MIPSLSVDRRPFAIRSFVRRSLIAILLMNQLTPALTPPAAAVPVAGVAETIGDFRSLAPTQRELQDAIEIAGAEVRGTLDQLNNGIDHCRNLEPDLPRESERYDQSLDAATRKKLLELQGLIDEVNQTLQQDIALASEAAEDVIRKASLEIRRATWNWSRARRMSLSSVARRWPMSWTG